MRTANIERIYNNIWTLMLSLETMDLWVVQARKKGCIPVSSKAIKYRMFLHVQSSIILKQGYQKGQNYTFSWSHALGSLRPLTALFSPSFGFNFRKITLLSMAAQCDCNSSSDFMTGSVVVFKFSLVVLWLSLVVVNNRCVEDFHPITGHFDFPWIRHSIPIHTWGFIAMIIV